MDRCLCPECIYERTVKPLHETRESLTQKILSKNCLKRNNLGSMDAENGNELLEEQVEGHVANQGLGGEEAPEFSSFTFPMEDEEREQANPSNPFPNSRKRCVWTTEEQEKLKNPMEVISEAEKAASKDIWSLMQFAESLRWQYGKEPCFMEILLKKLYVKRMAADLGITRIFASGKTVGMKSNMSEKVIKLTCTEIFLFLRMASSRPRWRTLMSISVDKGFQFSLYVKDMLTCIKPTQNLKMHRQREEGVGVYARENKNVPWKKILVFGSGVFNSKRQPADLKDKWRSMQKKVD